MPKILKTSIHKGETGCGKAAECEQSFWSGNTSVFLLPIQWSHWRYVNSGLSQLSLPHSPPLWRSKPPSLDCNSLVLLYPAHLPVLILIQFCQTAEASQSVSFGKTSIRPPPPARQRASCPTRSGGAKRPPKSLLRKEHFSFPSLESHSDELLRSHRATRPLVILLNEIITRSNSQCSTTGWPILHPFQRTGRSTAALWNRFWIPLIPLGSHFILYFTFLHTASSSIPISFSVVL